MAKNDTLAPNEPREITWAGVEMYRCPLERCGFSHEDRDEIVDHITETGHIGPDPVNEEKTTKDDTPDKSGTKGGD